MLTISWGLRFCNCDHEFIWYHRAQWNSGSQRHPQISAMIYLAKINQYSHVCGAVSYPRLSSRSALDELVASILSSNIRSMPHPKESIRICTFAPFLPQSHIPHASIYEHNLLDVLMRNHLLGGRRGSRLPILEDWFLGGREAVQVELPYSWGKENPRFWRVGVLWRRVIGLRDWSRLSEFFLLHDSGRV